MSKEGQPVLLFLVSLARLVTPGEAVKDSLLAGAAPAVMFLAHVETALVIGVLNVLVVAVFRGVELWLKYGRKGQARNDSNSP
jgi:uncharacterized membrane protein YagU involved in acid resistance